MDNENDDQEMVEAIIAAKKATVKLGIVLLGVLLFMWVVEYIDGLKVYRNQKEVAEAALWEKYGEEFIIHNTYPKASHEFFADCSPVSDKEVVFLAAFWKDGSGVVYDEYLQGILGSKVEREIEEELRKYYDSFFVEAAVSYNFRADAFYEEVSNIQDATIEKYAERFKTSWCQIDIGIDAGEGNGNLKEEYAFYESMQEMISKKKMLPMRNVYYYNMDAELQEWCNDYFTQNGAAYGTYTSKLAECNEMSFECTAEGVSITCDEFITMREELGKDE